MGKKKKGSSDAPRTKSEGRQEAGSGNEDSKPNKQKNKKS